MRNAPIPTGILDSQGRPYHKILPFFGWAALLCRYFATMGRPTTIRICGLRVKRGQGALRAPDVPGFPEDKIGHEADNGRRARRRVFAALNKRLMLVFL